MPPPAAINANEDKPRALRERWLSRFRNRYSLRLHMSLIVLATTSAGVATNWALLKLGWQPLSLRVLLAVLFTYFIFLGLVRLWLLIVAREGTPVDLVPDALDGVSLINLSSPAESSAGFAGEGGQFGGAGAQASFDGPATAASSGASPTSGGGGVDIPVPDLDGAGFVLLCLFLLLVSSFFVAGGYLVWEAPVILAETLFEFSLASVLLRKLKKTDQSDWMGHLLKLTWKPFAGVLVATLVFCGAIAWLRPEAHRLHDLWREPVPTATGFPPTVPDSGPRE